MIHKHTLAYRLKRVEQLTGRSLATTGDLAELWLALRALDVVGTLDYTERVNTRDGRGPSGRAATPSSP